MDQPQSHTMKIIIKNLDEMGHVSISLDEMGLDEMERCFTAWV